MKNLKLNLFVAFIICTIGVSSQQITYETLIDEEAIMGREIDQELVVGKTPSSHSVSPTGAFTYNVPIRIPKGTNGMEPQVSLAYNSQGGNGLLGYGWSIAGLSAISRVNRTHYHEGKAENATLDFSDPMAIDGNRLVLEQGLYGQDGSIYKTEAESFSKITVHGIIGRGAEWIEVETKQGIIMEYGRTSNSKVYSNGNFHVIAWKINRTIDRDGNYIDYEYQNIDKEHLIKKISYTGNLINDQSPYAHINFYYAARQDDNKMYANEHGKEIIANHLLESIDITYGEPNDSYKRYELKYGINFYSYLNEIVEFGKLGSSNQFNSLKFSYHDAGHEYSEVNTNVTSGSADYFPGDFNGDGKTDLLRANFTLNFSDKTYNSYELILNSDAGYISPISLNLPTGLILQKGYNVDIQRDAGLLYLNVGDFDGNGKTDIVVIHAHRTGANDDTYIATIEIRYSDCIGINASFNTSFLAVYGDYIGMRNAIIQGDFNGDGAMDLYCNFHDGVKNDEGVDPDNWYKPAIYLPRISTMPHAVYNVSNFENRHLSYKDLIYPMDMNGDGKTEIMQVYEHNDVNKTVVKEFIYDPQGFFMVDYLYIDDHGTNDWANFPNRDEVVEIGDFNGDGKSDIITSRNNNKHNWIMAISNGRSFNRNPTSYTFDADSPDEHILISDFNGDGKSDVLTTRDQSFSSTTELNIYYSKGLSSNGLVNFELHGSTFSTRITSASKISLIDYDGDGAIEILSSWLVSNPLKVGDFSKDNKFGQLAYISTGYDELTKINYASISKETNVCRKLYTPEHTGVYPLIDFHVPIFVTSSVSIPNGNGLNDKVNNRIRHRYFYKHAKLHKQGKGFMGFEYVQSEEEYINGNNIIPTVFSSDQYEVESTHFFPRLIKSYSSIANYMGYEPNNGTTIPCVSERSIDNNLVSKEFFYSTINLPNNRFINQLDHSMEGDNLNGVAIKKEYLFNAPNSSIHGNPSQIIITKGQGTPELEVTQTNLTYGQFGTIMPAAIISNSTIITRGAEPAFVIENHLDYYMNSGRLKQELKINPTNGNVVFEKNYVYHSDFGLPIELTENVIGHANPIRETIFEYDPLGRFLIKKINPMAYEEEWTYNELSGRKSSYDDLLPNNLLAYYNYDDFHRLTMHQDEKGNQTNISRSFDYSVAGGVGEPEVRLYKKVVNTTNLGEETTWYDHLGNVRKGESDGFNQKRFSYQNYTDRGFVEEKTDPFFGTTLGNKTFYYYDEYGRIINTQLIDVNNTILNTTAYSPMAHTGITAPYSYTNRDITNTSIRMDGVTTSQTFDATGKLKSSVDGGGLIEYTYFSNGNLKNTTLDGTLNSSMTYDEFGNQTSLNEMNSGLTTYSYNVIGELMWQEDAKGNQTNNLLYDELGRLLEKTTPEGNYTYTYSNSGNSIGQLTHAVAPNNYENEYSYNSDGELIQLIEQIDGKNYETSYTYNADGQLETETYHSGSVVEHSYTSNGYLEKVYDHSGSKNANYFLGTKQNEYGRWIEYNLLSGTRNSLVYNSVGMLSHVRVMGIYERKYDFDIINGNLNSRENIITGNIEEFDYDNLDRLKKIDLNGSTIMNLTFSSNGNINTKTDVGNYAYHPSKKNAVKSITNPTGDITTTTQLIDYDAQHNPKTIIENDIEWHFEYGPFHQRKRATIIDNNTGISKTRIYTVNAEYEIDQQNEITTVEYVSGGDGLCGIKVIETHTATEENYGVYKDYLGSIELIVDRAGRTIAEQSFDAWGRYRDPQTWQISTGFQANTPDWLWRGYTRHEHLEEFQLINMNGRMYDPYLGRMLSPDNVVQLPNATQNYNRYSYVMNNPLKYTDPSGELVWFVPVIAGAIIGGYVGGSIQQGSGGLSRANWNPTGGSQGSWDNTAWKGITVGAIAGAGIGLGVSAGFAAAGANITGISAGSVGFASTGATTAGWNVTANALITANINMASNAIQGGGWGQTAKSGLVGLAAGALTAGVEIGLSNNNVISTSGNSTTLKLFESDISAIAQAVGGGTNGAIDRYIRLREEGVRGWELFGYTTLGFFEGAAIGGLSGGVWSSNSLVQTGLTSSITSVPGLGYSILDYHTLSVSHIGGINKKLRKQTPKYPRVLSLDKIFNGLISIL